MDVGVRSPLVSAKSTKEGSLIRSSGLKDYLVKASSSPSVGLSKKPQVESDAVVTARDDVCLFWADPLLHLLGGLHSTSPARSSPGISLHRISLPLFFLLLNLLPRELNLEEVELRYSSFRPSTSR